MMREMFGRRRVGRKYFSGPVVVVMALMIWTGCVSTPAPQRRPVSADGPVVRQNRAVSKGIMEKEDIPLISPVNRKEIARPGGPLADFKTANFVGSARCALCHERLVDGRGNDMSISNHWRSTMMANAAKDPLWLAKVSSEVARHPALKEIIEKKCATCHMPMAWTQTQAAYQKPTILQDGFLSPANDLHAAAMDGVSCSFCHQVQDKDMGEPASFSGGFTVDTGQSGIDRLIFGPYREPFTQAMQKGVEFTPAYGPQMNDAALCATCHTLFTPYVDGQGEVRGTFPEQTPYLEWLHSDYGVPVSARREIDGMAAGQGKLCQECHMPHSRTGGVFIASPAPTAAQPKDHFSQHHFVGGNVFMLNVLQDNIANLKLTASYDKLQDTKERTLVQLQSATAGLEFAALEGNGDELTATVRVENRVGHKFPSGIPTRQTWVNLLVTDAAGQPVFESGRPLADGRIAGNNADLDGQGYEPHYDVISREDQVQIYEAVMADTDGELTYTLLRAAGYLKDNRLLPKGFDKQTASPEIGVYGKAATDDSFGGGSDLVTYRVNTAGRPAPFTVRATLYFTTVSDAFVKDLLRDDALYAVRQFGRYYGQADKTPVALAAVQGRIR